MSKWEDIVKDKLEGYESKLPEGSLAEFRALRAGAGSARPKRRSPAVWAAAAAVAAGLAAVLFLRQPQAANETVAPVVAETVDTPAIDTPTVDTPTVEPETIASSLPIQPLLAQAARPKAVRPRAPKPEVAEPAAAPQQPDAPEEPAEPTEPTEPTAPETVQPQAASPFIPEYADPQYSEPREIRLKAAPVAGVIAGGGVLAAVAVPLLKGTFLDAAESFPMSDGHHSGIPDRPNTDPVTNEAHHFPLKTGLSLRIPVSERLNLTTGLEYSLYCSEITREVTGTKKQSAHYLGVPVRLDWTLVSGRWLDAYVGAGVSGDKCFAAYLDGKADLNGVPLAVDPFAFSLLGAGGVQLNLSKRLGLFAEPEVSWVVPWQPRMLDTYRSENPVMFSVATGLRINLGK